MVIIADMSENMKLPVVLIERLALEYRIDPVLFQAFILLESGGNKYAVQYQPGYRHLYQVYEFSKKLYITYVTEKVFQQSSHGLVQIMGATARSLGFKGYPQQLYDTETNLRYGAKFIGQLQMRYPNKLDLISSYNQGQPFKTKDGFYKNQEYVNKVLKKIKEIDIWNAYNF